MCHSHHLSAAVARTHRQPCCAWPVAGRYTIPSTHTKAQPSQFHCSFLSPRSLKVRLSQCVAVNIGSRSGFCPHGSVASVAVWQPRACHSHSHLSAAVARTHRQPCCAWPVAGRYTIPSTHTKAQHSQFHCSFLSPRSPDPRPKCVCPSVWLSALAAAVASVPMAVWQAWQCGNPERATATATSVRLWHVPIDSHVARGPWQGDDEPVH
jgi:hypothetical protein